MLSALVLRLLLPPLRLLLSTIANERFLARNCGCSLVSNILITSVEVVVVVVVVVVIATIVLLAIITIRESGTPPEMQKQTRHPCLRNFRCIPSF